MNELYRGRVDRATRDTLERVEHALYDLLGLKYLPLRIRDAIVDGIQWAARAAQRPHAREVILEVEKRVALPLASKPFTSRKPPLDTKVTNPKPAHHKPDSLHPNWPHHRNAILPPPPPSVPRQQQLTMEIRPEDMVWDEETEVTKSTRAPMTSDEMPTGKFTVRARRPKGP